MLKWGGFFLGSLLVFLESGMAQTEGKMGSDPKTETIEIPTGELPPPSAEKITPAHPFFSESNTGEEIMEKLEALEERVKKLEENFPVTENGNIRLQSKSNVSIQSSNGDIIIHAPGTIRFEAKKVAMPQAAQ